MDIDIIENLKKEKTKWENRIYGVGETRIDLMIEDVIRALEKYQNELEKKDKVINEMAKEIADITGSCPYDKYDYPLDCSLRCEEGIEAECWKEYFTNKAENVGE